MLGIKTLVVLSITAAELLTSQSSDGKTYSGHAPTLVHAVESLVKHRKFDESNGNLNKPITTGNSGVNSMTADQKVAKPYNFYGHEDEHNETDTEEEKPYTSSVVAYDSLDIGNNVTNAVTKLNNENKHHEAHVEAEKPKVQAVNLEKKPMTQGNLRNISQVSDHTRITDASTSDNTSSEEVELDEKEHHHNNDSTPNTSVQVPVNRHSMFSEDELQEGLKKSDEISLKFSKNGKETVKNEEPTSTNTNSHEEFNPHESDDFQNHDDFTHEIDADEEVEPFKNDAKSVQEKLKNEEHETDSTGTEESDANSSTSTSYTSPIATHNAPDAANKNSPIVITQEKSSTMSAVPTETVKRMTEEVLETPKPAATEVKPKENFVKRFFGKIKHFFRSLFGKQLFKRKSAPEKSTESA